jgi:hypothetical protein
MYLVLVALTAILMARNHAAIFLSSEFISITRSERLGPEFKVLVSSANKKDFRVVQLGKSFI